MSQRRYGFYILGVASVINVINYGNRNVLVPMYEDLRLEFAFSNSELGLLGTAFMAAHAVVTLFFGWAGDRFDKRRVLAGGLLLWSVAALASAAAFDFRSMVVSRAVVGIGTAACVPVGIALLCQVYPSSMKARTVSIFNMGIFVGSAVGIGVGASLGYPYGVLVMGLPGFALAVLVARLDLSKATVAAPSRVEWRVFVAQSIELLSLRTMRWVLLGAALMAFAAGSYVAWFFDFVAVDKGMGPDRAFVLFGVALVGSLLGVLAGGIIGDRLHTRRPYGRLAAISIGMAVSVPFTVLFLYSEVGVTLYVASLLSMFFMTWYHGPLAAVVDDLSSDHNATTAQALVIFSIHLLGTAPSSWIIGELADEFGLRAALLLPTGVIAVAALVFMGGWRSIAADREALARSRPQMVETL